MPSSHHLAITVGSSRPPAAKAKVSRMNKTTQFSLGVVLLPLLAFLAFPHQARATVTVGWLPVPPEDLALKDNPKQPGADAMILYRENVVDARKATSTGDTVEEYVRIKIFHSGRYEIRPRRGAF